MKRENPLDEKGPEAAFARKAGWQVIEGTNEMWRVVPPPPILCDPKLRWSFQTISACWGIAAARAGFRPNRPGPIETRPSPTLKLKQGRPAASVNVLRKD